jgi:hypothetical protein
MSGAGPRNPLTELTDHEAIIRSILVRPFKVPIPGYSGALHGRSLGIRKTSGKRALYDPDAPGALILYTPPPPPPGAIEVAVRFNIPIYDMIILSSLL